MVSADKKPVLEVDGIQVFYGRVPAVNGVSLRLNAGEIVSVIGPNGAGKSSCLNAIMGVLPPHARARGAVRLNGQPIEHMRVEERVRARLSLVPEKRELFGSMSVLDNLTLGAQSRRRTEPKRWLAPLDHVYELFPRLRERSHQLAGTLSGGERQMLALGRALMGEPSVLMLDEPSLGLAPLVVREVLEVVRRLKGSRVSVLLVEQNARAALQISDHAYVLEGGAVCMEGPASLLQHDPRLINAYLGSATPADGTALTPVIA